MHVCGKSQVVGISGFGAVLFCHFYLTLPCYAKAAIDFYKQMGTAVFNTNMHIDFFQLSNHVKKFLVCQRSYEIDELI